MSSYARSHCSRGSFGLATLRHRWRPGRLLLRRITIGNGDLATGPQALHAFDHDRVAVFGESHRDPLRQMLGEDVVVGDVVEVRDFVTGEWSHIALAGPANRQGRIAADVIAGRDSRFRGSQGTAIIGLFGAAIAWTGTSEKALKRLGDTDYEKIYLYPNSHAGYYPGAKPIAMKVLFRRSDGRLLGAQALGQDGPAVDKRISAFATMIQMGATIYDLEEAELCYAPQFGSAKDPLNFAGMVAADVLKGDMPISHWASIENEFILGPTVVGSVWERIPDIPGLDLSGSPVTADDVLWDGTDLQDARLAQQSATHTPLW